MDTLRFGSCKGKTLAECDTKALHWYAKVLRESIADPEKERYLANNQAMLDEAEAIIARREESGGEGPPLEPNGRKAAPAPSQRPSEAAPGGSPTMVLGLNLRNYFIGCCLQGGQNPQNAVIEADKVLELLGHK